MSLDGAITNLASWAGNTIMPTMAGMFFAGAVYRYSKSGPFEQLLYGGFASLMCSGMLRALEGYQRLEEDIRSAMREHRGNKSLMSILLNTLLVYPDHPYDFDEIWARAFDPQTKEYVKFRVTVPENLTRDALYAKERALIADVKEELRQGRRPASRYRHHARPPASRCEPEPSVHTQPRRQGEPAHLHYQCT
jgi:hypothetical protein